MISFGKRLKELRRAREITQEQAAEYLGVSSQAVSRWECGSTSPDIYILPALSEMLGVSIETLLGVNTEQISAQIEKIVEKCEADINDGKTVGAIMELRTALRTYPHSERLQLCLLYALYVASEDEDFCREHDDEIISIAERIDKYSSRRDWRDEARRLLFRHYIDTGRRDEAIRLTEEMAMMETCFERNIYWALEDSDRVPFLKKRIAEDMKYLCWDISALSLHSDMKAADRERCDEILRTIDEVVKSVPVM